MNLNLTEVIPVATADATVDALVKAGKLPGIAGAALKPLIAAVVAVEGGNAVQVQVTISVIPVRGS